MKFCTQCGRGNVDDADFCIQCGTKLGAEGEAPVGVPLPIPYQGPAYVQVAPQQQTDGMCIASMVLGIVSIWMSPLGIVLGPLAIYYANRGKDIVLADPHLKGDSFALVGRICGIIGTVLSSLFVLLIIIAVIVSITSH